MLPQLKGARVRITQAGAGRIEGMILGLDRTRKKAADTVIEVPLLSLLVDDGAIRSFELPDVSAIQILDESVRADLDYYLKTELSAKKKDTRTFSIFARGEGKRRIRLAYNVAAPVWKATYRMMLGEAGKPPQIQGWAVVDNTQDEDWENVALSLVSGLPVSFIHDLYTPRYIRRPTVEVQETTGVLPPEVEDGMAMSSLAMSQSMAEYDAIEERSAPAMLSGMARSASRPLLRPWPFAAALQFGARPGPRTASWAICSRTRSSTR